VITAEAPLRTEPLGESLKRAEDGNHQYTRVSYDDFQQTCEENNNKTEIHTLCNCSTVSITHLSIAMKKAQFDYRYHYVPNCGEIRATL